MAYGLVRIMHALTLGRDGRRRERVWPGWCIVPTPNDVVVGLSLVVGSASK
jgi:hypothetical protein